MSEKIDSLSMWTRPEIRLEQTQCSAIYIANSVENGLVKTRRHHNNLISGVIRFVANLETTDRQKEQRDQESGKNQTNPVYLTAFTCASKKKRGMWLYG